MVQSLHTYKETKRVSTMAANLLLSLSLSSNLRTSKKSKKKRNSEGVFECRTCNRKFDTFQALGGHRTSHLRPKVRSNGLELVIGEKKKEKKRHVCGFCGKEFLMGQALGGHMKLHKSLGLRDHRGDEIEFDLNMPPFKEDSGVILLKLFE